MVPMRLPDSKMQRWCWARAFADCNYGRTRSAQGNVIPNEFARKMEDGNK